MKSEKYEGKYGSDKKIVTMNLKLYALVPIIGALLALAVVISSIYSGVLRMMPWLIVFYVVLSCGYTQYFYYKVTKFRIEYDDYGFTIIAFHKADREYSYSDIERLEDVEEKGYLWTMGYDHSGKVIISICENYVGYKEFETVLRAKVDGTR